MSDINEETLAVFSLSTKDETAKTHAFISYCLMILGLFTGIFFIIGVVWAMVKKEEAQGTLFEDHYTNIIKTFWWGLGLTILGVILSVIFIGYFILLAVWIWSIFRILKGLAKITSNKAYHA